MVDYIYSTVHMKYPPFCDGFYVLSWIRLQDASHPNICVPFSKFSSFNVPHNIHYDRLRGGEKCLY